ncbi:MAG: IMPACT family protein [Anaeroplasmataceae bacterium]
MFTIEKDNVSKTIINKSEFITHIYKVNSIKQINEYIETIKADHRQANHNCFAYSIMVGDQIQKKCSDDGEPSRTAGAPILDVIEKNNLINVLIIVTRYFGGVMLGAGGLVRAYSTSASNCLKEIKFYNYIKVRCFKSKLSYPEYNVFSKVESLIILKTEFNDLVNLEFCSLDINLEYILKTFNNLVNGRIKVIETTSKYIEVL